MDLLSHIPGVNVTGSFTPGAATPSPFNVAHVGGIDGTGPNNATKNMAEIYNRLLLDRAALIQMAGLSIDNTNWVQAAQAAALMSGGLHGGNCPVTGPTTAPTAASPYRKYTSVTPYFEEWEYFPSGWRVVANRYGSAVISAISGALAGGSNLVLSTPMPRAGKVFVHAYSSIPAGTAATHTVLVGVGAAVYTGTRSVATSGVEPISTMGITVEIASAGQNLDLYAYPALAGAPSHGSFVKYQYFG